MLKPQLQTELVEYLFGQSIIKEFGSFFDQCERIFINKIVVSFVYRSFEHNQLIQSPKAYCDEVFFIRSGGIVACEPTSYHEPILVYGKGSVINVYQVIMDDPLDFSLYAICDESYKRSLDSISKSSNNPSDEEDNGLEINY